MNNYMSYMRTVVFNRTHWTKNRLVTGSNRIPINMKFGCT